MTAPTTVTKETNVEQRHRELFEPLRIGRMQLRNRIVAPPMVQARPITSREGIGWYRRLAAGGVGLVIIEATGTPSFGKNLTVNTLTPLVKAIHAEGAAVAIQLFPIPFGTTADLNALTAAEIDDLAARYGPAAEICRDAGMEGVEPHGAHGFLLNQFFMPDRNKRTDAWGASPENRGRLGVEIVRNIRAAAGDALAIFYRHTPAGTAYSVDDSLKFARRLIDAGVGVLDISPSRDKEIADMAAPFKKLGVPVIAVNGMNDPDASADALRAAKCDLVAIARGLIADSQWPLKVRDGRLAEIVQCTECNDGCFGNLNKGKAVECVHWKKDEVRDYTR